MLKNTQKILPSLAVLIATTSICALASASEYPEVIVKKGAVVCFERDDWMGLAAEAVDGNTEGALRYLASGKCIEIKKDTKVSYLDPVRGNAALIQMPSGRGAYTSARYIGK